MSSLKQRTSIGCCILCATLISILSSANAAVYKTSYSSNLGNPFSESLCSSDIPIEDERNCGHYYQCVRTTSSWKVHRFRCPNLHKFNPETKGCGPEKCSGPSPVDYDPIPHPHSLISSLISHECHTEGEKFVDPNDCKNYLECAKSPNGQWNKKPQLCQPPGYTFDDSTKECVELYGFCPQTKANFPAIGLCVNANDLYVNPVACNRYFRCHMHTNNKFYPEERQCRAGENFDNTIKECVHGDCPQSLIPLPEGWICLHEGYTNANFFDCSKYYQCVKCSGGWCIYNHDCEPGHFFNRQTKTCVAGEVCPDDLNILSSSWGDICNNEFEIVPHVEQACYGDYIICRKCSEGMGWCYQPFSCPEGEFYDYELRYCVPLPVCPNDLAEIPDYLSCERDGEKKVVPGNCKQYHTCYKCRLPALLGKWCYPNEDEEKCRYDQFFDSWIGECVKIDICPNELLPITGPLPGGSGVRTCNIIEENHVDPEECSKHYTCYPCNHPEAIEGWCYYTESCMDGTMFDELTKVCVAGPCPQDLTPIGPGMQCTGGGELHVFPTDCTRFYTCYQCGAPGGWCFIGDKCDMGYFDESNQRCVNIAVCPQDLIETEPGMTCSANGETHALPSDCTGYYTCYECNKRIGWCYVEETCNGGYYSEKEGTCVDYDFCPQKLTPIEPGMVCSVKGEVHVHPTNCKSFYTCYACGPGEWCYIAMDCPQGHFDEYSKTCVDSEVCPQELTPIEPGMECSANGQIHVHPTDCTAFYTCYECSRGWCYKGGVCESGFFSEKDKACVDYDVCPQDLLEIEEGMTCSTNGETHVHPSNCHNSYTCYKCGDEWCFHLGQCGSGYFDDKIKTCVETLVCPQDLTPIRPEMMCEAQGEIHVLPNDCHGWYTCYKCGGGGEGWCFISGKCDGGDSWFDELTGQCVTNEHCPQDIAPPPPPPPIPPRPKCRRGTTGDYAIPGVCNCFVRCSCLLWCSTLEWCCLPDHYFDPYKRTCYYGSACPAG